MASSARFPKSIKIAVWNCRGILHKKISVALLFESLEADILVLNETFRRPNTPWPCDLPPCLAEATSETSSATRSPNGVAVLANPRSLGHHGRIRSFSVIDTDNINGLKVVLKINQFIIFAVYAPTSAGPGLLRDVAVEAKNYASNGQPVILCGDLNAPHAESLEYVDYLARNRGRTLIEHLGQQFFRVDTGVNPTRPSNRLDSVSNEGSFIDHIFVANANGLDGMCHSDFAHASDHHPISARIRHRNPPDDTSIKYWRLRLERLKKPEVKSAYYDAVQAEISSLHSSIVAACPPTLTRLSPVVERQTCVANMEKIFVGGIMKLAQRVIGRKAVPVVSSAGKSPYPNEDYRSTALSLSATYDDLRRYAGLGPDNARVRALLLRRDELKSRLTSLERSSQTVAYHTWRDELCQLPVSQRLKILNRVMRRRSAAGACLSSTPIALDSYRSHFEAQFRNDHGIEPFEDAPVLLDQSTELSIAVMTFSPEKVQQMILRSPPGKAPGASGLPAELLHPVAELISPSLALMFAVYMNLSVVPPSWKRALICPVPKKGDLSRISNYRPISLTEVTRKIFEMTLLYRFQSTNELTLSREQGGFREGRSTIDQVQCLDMVTKSIRRQGRKVFMAFLDIKAAYDSVPRGELWRQCEQQGMDHVTLSCLRSLFDHNSAQLVVSQHRSRPIALPAGVLQGSVLSPLLYSIYLDPLVEKLKAHGPRIPLSGSSALNALLYADDIALIASSPRDLRRLLELAEEDSLERGYRFSPAKCVVVGMDHSTYKLYNAPLVHQRSFCYLGIEVNCRGIEEKKHAKTRAGKAIKAAERLKQAGARFRNFPVQVNIQLYAAFVRPGLEYGITLVHQNRGAMWILQMAQKQILCSFLGVNVNARSDVIEAITSCPSLNVRCKILRSRRAEKLQTLWSREDCLEHALIFAQRALHGDDLRIDPDLQPIRPPVIIRMEEHFTPITESLASRYGGFVTIGLLRWVLLLKLPAGIFRTILLWILQRWRIFGNPRLCQHCRSPFTCQYHIVSCAGLRHRLVEECIIDIVDLDSTTHSPEAVVEHFLSQVMAQTLHSPDMARIALTHLETSIRSCLALVFGPSNL